MKTQKFGNWTITYNYTLSGSSVAQNNVTNRLWNKTTYFYDENLNTVKKIIHKSTGDVTYLYEYTADNKLDKEIYPDNSGYTYTYDENGNIIEKRLKADVSLVDSIDDIVTSTVYDLKWNIPTQITAANGLVTKFTLDDFGNITKKEVLWVKDVENIDLVISESYEYNTKWERIKQTDAGNLVTTFDYLSGSLVQTTKGTGSGAIITKYDYDTSGNISAITDAMWNKTLLSYDNFNLLSNQITPEGITTETTYNKLNKKVNERIILSNSGTVNTAYLYDILDNPIQVTKDIDVLRKNILVAKYDADSRVIETQNWSGALSKFSYNETGKIIQKVITSWTTEMITNYEYDSNDRLTKEISSNESATLYEYDLHGKLVKQIFADKTYAIITNDKIGNVLETKKYSASGSLLTKQSAEYDLLNRAIISKNYILGEVEKEIITKVKYNEVWNVIESIDAENKKTQFIFDEYHRLKETITPEGNKVTQVYNKNDKIIEKTIISIEGKTLSTHYEYDKDNRLVKQTDSDNTFEEFSYNNLNQIVQKIDKNKNIIQYSYDYSGNLIKETQWEKIVRYDYDERGNMIKLIDANNNETVYKYNTFDRLIQRIYPDTTSVHYEHDIQGNIIKTTDANGTITMNSYDTLNRLTQRDISTGSWVIGVTFETYEYDDLGRLIWANDSNNNFVGFSYDSLGRLLSEENDNKTVQYDYDIFGNTTEILYPNKRKISYEYDTQNRLSKVLHNNTVINTYNYDSLSLLSQKYNNNLITNYSYDDNLKLSWLSLSGATELIYNYNYSYDNIWNMLSDGTDVYKYDQFNQLTDAVDEVSVNSSNYTVTRGQKFIYDLMWNRTKKSDYARGEHEVNRAWESEFNLTDYSKNSLNQYSDSTFRGNTTTAEPVVSNYKYDTAWNLVNNGTHTFTYDYKNRVVQIHKVSGSLVREYEYDVLGRRISDSYYGKEKRHVYAGKRLIWEYDVINLHNTSTQYIYGTHADDVLVMVKEELLWDKAELDEHTFCKQKITPSEGQFIKYNWKVIIDRCATVALSISKQTNLYYYHKNHLGSTMAITDSSGNTVEKYKYDIFWEPRLYNPEHKRWDWYNSKLWNTRLFTGREYDTYTKLYYNRARYYSPVLWRFIARDPIDIADDINLYSYVANNPVMYVDLKGTEKILIIYSTNHFYDPWSTKIASENLRKMLLDDWYDNNDIKLVSITTAEDFISNVNEFTNNYDKWDIAYV